MKASVELLRQPDDDALGPADVAEPIAVLVLHHLADEVGAVGLQAGKDVLDVVDGEHDATDTQRVHRCVRLGGGGGRRVELSQLKPAVAVRRPQHGDVASDTVESDDAVYPRSLDCRLALQLQTKLDKERGSGLKVVDHDADVVHPQKRHVPEYMSLMLGSLGTAWAQRVYNVIAARVGRVGSDTRSLPRADAER